MSKETEVPAGSALIALVRPFAWLDPLYLRVRQTGGLMSVTDFPSEIRTAPLYTQAALDAAVTAERERLITELKRAATANWTARSQDAALWAVDVLKKA